MKRSEAYHILGDLWGKATPEQKEAINMAQRDLEFVDLMPKDMVHVVRCEDCARDGICAICDEAPEEYGEEFFCACGKRKDGDG